ncbi:MAG: hypothetical protein MUE33_03560 [Cytophagaceae bacterium]|jgi:hypothetical protein|nr:hypothetical protein [Cytophagaceae bacterium]
MSPYYIVFLWAAFITLYSAKAANPQSIQLGLNSSSHVTQSVYSIETSRQISSIWELYYIQTPVPCILESASIYNAHRVHEFGTAWESPYGFEGLNDLTEVPILRPRSCKSFGFNLVQF